jgi:hypothetical protein
MNAIHVCRYCPAKFAREGAWEKHTALCKLKKSSEPPSTRELTHAVVYLMGRVEKLEADARMRADTPLAKLGECAMPTLGAADLREFTDAGLQAMLERHEWPVRAVEKKVYSLADGEWSLAAPAHIEALLGSIKHQLEAFLNSEDDDYGETVAKLYCLEPSNLRAALLKIGL